MPRYLNRVTKQIGMILAGCVGFADVLLKSTPKLPAAVRYPLWVMYIAAQAALDALMDGVDQTEKDALIRYSKHCQLMVMPETDPRLNREYYIVPDTAMSIFLKQATGDCFLCDKEGKEYRKCEIRKALLDSMVLGINDRGDCPDKEG